MICDKCGYEIPEGSKFCPECGNKVEEKKEPEIVLTLDTEPETKEEPVEMPSIEEIKEWYFVEDQKSMGPYTVSDMKSYIDSGRIHRATYAWKQGMDEWKTVEACELSQFLKEEPVQEEMPKDMPKDNIEWYYINQMSQQVGPLSMAEMIDLIDKEIIKESTYVWSTGMKDWIFAKDSILASAFKKNVQPTVNAIPIFTNMNRNIAMCIILSIVTCGIYTIYWAYIMARDVNLIMKKYGNESQQTSAGLVILFSILTCGIYQLYWLYQCGKRLSRLQFNNGYKVVDDSVIMLVLSIFGLSIVSYCILQSAVNDIQSFAN